MASVKDKQLRRERILQFIRENRDATPPAVLQTPRKEDNSLRQKKRVTFIHGRQPRSLGDLVKVKEKEGLIGQGLTSCLITKSSNTRIPADGERMEKKLSRRASDCPVKPSDNRITGGANDPSVRNVGKLPRTDSECKFYSPGVDFLKTRHTEHSVQELKLTPVKSSRKELKNKCDFFPKYVDNRPFKDQTTQTLYRESSAQTLAYLPEINNTTHAETLELFSLPKILPGDKPPGLQEVEILERARKRWRFNEAIKTHFKMLFDEAKSVAMKSDILEAFEWERWIEREESIQECQMMRLQIVIKMFDKREREMHAASKIRIEMACERIEKRRQAGLRKNEVEFERGMRRLNSQLAKRPQKWVKQSPMHALGSTCSEFYGPMMRHGIDPARRSFESTTGRKAFDMRIDDLEKRVNMQNVECPFSKLRQWSKPKEYVREYEQNFCNDGNLQRLYESLKSLRTQADHVAASPNCRKTRLHIRARVGGSSSSEMFDNRKLSRYSRYSDRKIVKPIYKVKIPRAKELASTSKGHEDLETLIHTYEGTYIGSIMQFLASEMDRLKDQRRLHFFCILAQRERWRREAGEAGLRQKEDAMRILYEEMFQHSNSGHLATSKEYINTLMTKDISQVMEDRAAETVTELARQIDEDIQRWLESFKLIQNPLNYVPLRVMLQGMITPDLDAALQLHEKTIITKYIVEDVIFGRVWEELEPFDVATTLTSDLIDRLIDNDLYLFSSDSETEFPQKNSESEAAAIIRKLIRQAVPGRRWLEEPERIVTETYNDLFDQIFAEILLNLENLPAINPSDLIIVHPIFAELNVNKHQKKFTTSISPAESLQNAEFMNCQLLNLFKKLKEDKITKDLQTDEKLKIDSDHSEIFDTFVNSQSFLKKEIVVPPAPPAPPAVDIISEVCDIIDTVEEGDIITNQTDLTNHKNQSNQGNQTSLTNLPVSSVPQIEPEVNKPPLKRQSEDVSKEEPRTIQYSEGKVIEPEENDSEPISEGKGSGEEILIYAKHESTLFSFR